MNNTKSTIINVATRLFAEQGFENTSISKICAEAKVSKGAIYHHFSSKNEILRSLFSITTKKMMDIGSAANSATNPKSQIIQIIENVFTQLENDKQFFKLNLNIMFQPSTRKILDNLIKERADFIFNQIYGIFKQLDQKHSLELSYILIAEIDGIALNYLSVFDNYPLEKIKNTLIQRYKDNKDF